MLLNRGLDVPGSTTRYARQYSSSILQYRTLWRTLPYYQQCNHLHQLISVFASPMRLLVSTSSMAAEAPKPDAASMWESMAGMVHSIACRSAAEATTRTETGCGTSHIQWPWRSSGLHRLGVLVCCTYRSAPALVIEPQLTPPSSHHSSQDSCTPRSTCLRQTQPSVRAPGKSANVVSGLNTAF